MKTETNYKILCIILILISLSSVFVGFFLNENAAGAGSYEGDIQIIWNNLQIFLSNDLSTSINNYYSSRTPLAYILHEIFNPFLENINNFRTSTFLISLTLPILFYFSLKKKFSNEKNLILILVSSIVCLSPYYRTSAFWGLEENYGLIALLIAFIFFNEFLKNKSQENYKVHLSLFMTTFFSSCCLYFDQKLIVIPLVCFITIILSDKLFKLKIFTIIYYLLFSLPYILLIQQWGGLLPAALLDPVTGRQLGNEIFIVHIGYASTMIAFYLLPLIFFKEKNLFSLIKSFFSNKKNYYLVFLFVIYLIYLINFYDFNEEKAIGKGFIHKASLLLFAEDLSRMIFIYFSFIVSWIIILLYVEKRLIDIVTIIYLFLLSVFIWPIHQEYFDPLILLMAFTFFNSKVVINFKNTIILYAYLGLLLVGSNIYYANSLN